MPPFVLLTSAVLTRARRLAPLATGAVMVLFAWKALPVVVAKEAYFPLDWGQPPPRVIEAYRNGQRSAIVRYRDRDHLELSTVGRWKTPLHGLYLDNLRAYRELLRSGTSLGQLRWMGWVRGANAKRDEELRWAEAEIQRFQKALD